MKNIIHNLSLSIEKYYPILKEIDDTIFSSKPNPEKWSKKEELGHLIDSAQNNIQRFIRIQYEEDVFVIYNPDNWVLMNDYQNVETKKLIELWFILNYQIISILQKMPTKNYEKLMSFDKDKTIQHNTLFVANDYVEHLTHHLENVNL